MSAHQYQSEATLAPVQFDDPAILNITAGSGILPSTLDAVMTLRSHHATTPEIRTLPDPLKSNIYLIMELLDRTAQNLVVRANTPLWVGTTVTQPAITQLGQYITFTAIHQVAVLLSVPCTQVSFTGTQATVVNKTGFRWMVEALDGPTVT